MDINKIFIWSMKIFHLEKIEGQKLSGLPVSFMAGQELERLRYSICR